MQLNKKKQIQARFRLCDLITRLATIIAAWHLRRRLLDKAHAPQPGPGASELDRAALAEAVATGWVVLHSWNPLGLRTAKSESDYVTAAEELERLSKAPHDREEYLATLPQIYYYSQVSGFRPTNHPLYRNRKPTNSHRC